MRRIVLLLFVLVFVNAVETENRTRRYEDKYHTKQQIGKPMIQKSRLTHCRDTIALIYEDFEAGMPTDWTVIDGNNDGHTWTTGTTFDLLGYQPPNYGSAYAFYSDDDAGSGAPAGTEYLIAPPVECAGALTLWLSYSWGFQLFDDPYGAVSIRFHNGTTWGSWNIIAIYQYSDYGVDTFDLGIYLPADSVQVRYTYEDPNGGWGFAFGIDNVNLYTDIDYHDIGVTRILSPAMGGVPPGDYDWIARIQNLGDIPETGDIHAYIYDTTGGVLIYDQTYVLTNFPPGGDTAAQFDTTISVPNSYYCVVIVEMGDDNPANDTLAVNSFVPESLGQHIYWIDAQTPTSSIALYGVEFDGTYFYLTGATAINETKVFVLDTLGNLIWTIDQPVHCTGYGWRDMAFDRAYVGPDRVDTLYASCNFDVDRFGINKTTGTLDYYGPLPGPINPNWPLAYMPESLYFFTADMSYIYKFIKNGAFVYQVTTPWLMHGAAYDGDTLGGGWIWWSTADTTAQFKKFDPNTMSFTSASFGCDYPCSGLGFAQDFRDMDVLFTIVDQPQTDFIYGFFLRWRDSTGIAEDLAPFMHTDFGFAPYLPNPIRKGMLISYYLSCKCPARLSVYDAAGRLVRTLVNATELAGNHTVEWDCKDYSSRNLPSGVYFLKLDGIKETQTKKLVYVD